MNEGQKQEFDCCASQAEIAFNAFNARRENQYRITLALWGLILLVTKFLLQPSCCTKHFWAPPAIILAAASVFVIHLRFVRGVWIKNSYDEELFRYFSNRGARIISGQEWHANPPKLRFPTFADAPDRWGFLSDGSSLFQIATTLALCVYCALALIA